MLVKEVCQNLGGSSMKFETSAMDALQESAEQWLTTIFSGLFHVDYVLICTNI